MREEQLRETLAADPGNPAFVDLAALLMAKEAFAEGIQVCLRGLSVNPDCHKGRLLLAHLMFRSGFIPFAAREVAYLCQMFPEHSYLASLLAKLDPGFVQPANAAEPLAGREVADVEFDPDALDGIE
jgi:hypothetical protein